MLSLPRSLRRGAAPAPSTTTIRDHDHDQSPSPSRATRARVTSAAQPETAANGTHSPSRVRRQPPPSSPTTNGKPSAHPPPSPSRSSSRVNGSTPNGKSTDSSPHGPKRPHQSSNGSSISKSASRSRNESEEAAPGSARGSRAATNGKSKPPAKAPNQNAKTENHVAELSVHAGTKRQRQQNEEKEADAEPTQAPKKHRRGSAKPAAPPPSHSASTTSKTPTGVDLNDSVIAIDKLGRFSAQIIGVDRSRAEPYLIHFRGWGSRHDRWVGPDSLEAPTPTADNHTPHVLSSLEREGVRPMPLVCFEACAGMEGPRRFSHFHCSSCTKPFATRLLTSEHIDKECGPAFDRNSRKRRRQDSSKGSRKKAKGKSGSKKNSSSTSKAKKSKETKPKTKAPKLKRVVDHTDTLCAICEEPGSLMCCEGGCLRAFHTTCLGLERVPSSWTCEECVSGAHPCFVCKRVRERGSGSPTIPCSQTSVCGKWYHTRCVITYSEARHDRLEHFVCPLHSCATCRGPISGLGSGSNAVRCVRCPIAYHLSCQPAGVHVVEDQRIVCRKHLSNPRAQLNDKTRNVNYCVDCYFKGDLVCCDSCPASYHPECVDERTPQPDDDDDDNSDSPKTEPQAENGHHTGPTQEADGARSPHKGKKKGKMGKGRKARAGSSSSSNGGSPAPHLTPVPLSTPQAEESPSPSSSSISAAAAAASSSSSTPHTQTQTQTVSPWFCAACYNGKVPTNGDVVWARYGNHRMWPAQVVDEADLPDVVLARRPTKDTTTKATTNSPQGTLCTVSVRWFGSHDYAWVHPCSLLAFRCALPKHVVGFRPKPAFLVAVDEAVAALQARGEARVQKGGSASKPPQYKKIRRNVFPKGWPKPAPDEAPQCFCSPDEEMPCGSDRCLNRAVFVECSPSSCPAGARCQNQCFSRNKCKGGNEKPLVQVYRTNSEQRGFGLQARVPLVEGQFITEYVGEIIDMSECQARLKAAAATGVNNFYSLCLDNNTVIDASRMGNESRFLNHSCQPNCMTQKWMVRGRTRVGIFARHNVAAGAELCIDYNFDCLGNGKLRCCCGMPNCKGLVG